MCGPRTTISSFSASFISIPVITVPTQPAPRHARVIQRANAGGFRESVRLQHENAKHQEKIAASPGERGGNRRSAAQVRAEALSNLRKMSRAQARARTYRVRGHAPRAPLPERCVPSANSERMTAAVLQLLLDAAPDTLQQRGNIQEIVRRYQMDFFREAIKIRRKSKTLSRARQDSSNIVDAAKLNGRYGRHWSGSCVAPSV